MERPQLDLWRQWDCNMALAVPDESPVINHWLYLYAYGEDGFSPETTAKVIRNHGGAPAEGNYTLQLDYLINLLYYAVIRARAGVKIFGLTGEDLEISTAELERMTPDIELLATLYGYKSNLIDLGTLAQELKGQTLFYSTLSGDHKGGSKPYVYTRSNQAEQYYPVFFSMKHLREYFTLYERPAYIVMSADLQQFLTDLNGNAKHAELGVAIEPLYSCTVALPPLFRIE